MSKVRWDQAGERLFEAGLDRAVLFVKEGAQYATGEPWNGLSAVTQSPSGAEPTKYYANNKVYATLLSPEEMGLTIEAYFYPIGWEECNGEKEAAPGLIISQQTRKQFGLTYRSLIGNDVDLIDHGYNLHILYDGLAGVSERAYNTINESTEPGTMSWEVSTTPVDIAEEGFKQSALVTINSTRADETKLKALEDMLYGTDGDGTPENPGTDPRLPSIDEVIAMFKTGG